MAPSPSPEAPVIALLSGIGGALAGLAVGCVVVYYGTRALTARNLNRLMAQHDEEAQARRAVLLARGQDILNRADQPKVFP